MNALMRFILLKDHCHGSEEIDGRKQENEESRPGQRTKAVVQVREDGARGHKGGSDNEEGGV